MQIRVLGTAAGGGFPQWNCNCKGCSAARQGKLKARNQSCIAVRGDTGGWFLLNAPPDLPAQIEACPDLHPGPGVRQTPIKGIILTDAELDHTLGLLVLREGAETQIFATAPVMEALEKSFPVKAILQRYARPSWVQVDFGKPFFLPGEELRVRLVGTGTKRPRYAEPSGSDDWVAGVTLEDSQSGRCFFYAPSLEQLSDSVIAEIDKADLAFLDGTFWTSQEMLSLEISSASAQQMGHLPLSGDNGLLDLLPTKPGGKVFLTHINNTNPILAGSHSLPVGIAEDGMSFTL